MADEASGVQRSIGKIKQWIGWSWTYLWGFWFLLVIFLLYVLRTPLRLKENLNLGGSLIFISFSGKNQEIGAVLIFLKKWLPSPAIEGQITIILKCSIKTIFLLIFSPFWYLIFLLKTWIFYEKKIVNDNLDRWKDDTVMSAVFTGSRSLFAVVICC